MRSAMTTDPCPLTDPRLPDEITQVWVWGVPDRPLHSMGLACGWYAPSTLMVASWVGRVGASNNLRAYVGGVPSLSWPSGAAAVCSLLEG